MMKSSHPIGNGYNYIRRIVGHHNIVTPREIQKIFPNVLYTKEELRIFLQTFPDENVFRRCCDGDYFFLPLPPKKISLWEIYKQNLELFYRKNDVALLRNAEAEYDNAHWLIIGKEPLRCSCDAQKKGMLLSGKAGYIPSATEVVFANVARKKIHGVHLQGENIFVITSSVDSNGNKICCGIVEGGISIRALSHSPRRETFDFAHTVAV